MIPHPLEMARSAYIRARGPLENKESEALEELIIKESKFGAPIVSFWAIYSNTLDWAKVKGFNVFVTGNSRKSSKFTDCVEVEIKISGWSENYASAYIAEAKKDTTKEYASLIRVLETWKATHGLGACLTPIEARDFILANSDAMVDTNGLTNTLKLFYENLGRKIDGLDYIAEMVVYDRRNYYFLNSSSEGHKCSIT